MVPAKVWLIAGLGTCNFRVENIWVISLFAISGPSEEAAVCCGFVCNFVTKARMVSSFQARADSILG